MDIMELDFDQWLEIGVRSGWVSPPVCYTHDGLPTSVTEDAEFEDGSDPCVHHALLRKPSTQRSNRVELFACDMEKRFHR